MWVIGPLRRNPHVDRRRFVDRFDTQRVVAIVARARTARENDAARHMAVTAIAGLHQNPGVRLN